MQTSPVHIMKLAAQRSRLLWRCRLSLLLAWLVLTPANTPLAQASPLRIGVLTPGLNFAPVLRGLEEGLANLGLREGADVKFLIEDSQGDLASLAGQAARLLDRKPDALFTVATAPTLVAKQATRTVPIVFAGGVDPNQSGMAFNFASSRNNLTGVTAFTAYLSGKRLEVLKDIAPATRDGLAIVYIKESVSEIAFQQLAQASARMGFMWFAATSLRSRTLKSFCWSPGR